MHLVGADAPIGPANFLHHRRIHRCVLHCMAACFAISLRGNCSRWERCLHAGGAVVQFCREIPVCWPQCFSTGFFCGLRYNPIRIQRLFLHTFSDKPEKVCRRRHGCGVAASTAVPVKPDKRADVHPQGVGRIRSAPSSLTAALAIGPYKLLCRIICKTTAVPPAQAEKNRLPAGRRFYHSMFAQWKNRK